MPAIQSTSNVSIVSRRCFNSVSVPARISMLRRSSGRTAVASFTNGSRMRSISRTPMYRSGTICTEKPGGSARCELPSCGVMLPRTTAAAREDLVDSAFLDHRRAVHAQQGLERGDERVPRNARRRADRDLTADRSVDRVTLVQDIAEDVPDDFAQVGALEVEHDPAAALLHYDGTGRNPAAGRLALHEHTRPLVQARPLVARSAAPMPGPARPRRQAPATPRIHSDPADSSPAREVRPMSGERRARGDGEGGDERGARVGRNVRCCHCSFPGEAGPCCAKEVDRDHF